MILAALALAAAPVAPLAQGLSIDWSAPDTWIEGQPYMARLHVEIPEGGADLDVWLLTPAGFTINGDPVAARSGGKVSFPGSASIEFDLDLSSAFADAGDMLSLAHSGNEAEAVAITVMKPAPAGLNFMEMPVEDLSKYRVHMTTNQGPMLMEFWPDVAPSFVRNFLDLSYTGFYDNLGFHRVIPGFMIQGGDPTGTGGGNGPRRIPDEFSDRKHVRGVLSMASSGPNTASCQFFVMHADAPHLDGAYNCFGQLVSGHETVDRIATTPRGARDKPKEPQIIQKAVVVLAQ